MSKDMAVATDILCRTLDNKSWVMLFPERKEAWPAWNRGCCIWAYLLLFDDVVPLNVGVF
jgi:hypothetical protein